MYTIAFRPDYKLLDIRWAGLFTADAVTAYARDLAIQFASHGFQAGYRLRIDMTDSGIQSQDAITRFATSFAAFPKASRIAVITPSALARMQVRREMPQNYLRIFAHAPEGLAWLIDERQSVAA